MFGLKRRFLISPEMSKCLKESTNKYISTHLKPNIKYMEDKHMMHLLLPFVSLVSFLFGYNFRGFIDN